MSNINEANSALVDCGHCHKQALGPRGWHSCFDCIKRIARENRCPDCDSHATLTVTDDVMHIDERHDATCHAWLAHCAANDLDPNEDIIWIGE